MSGRRIATTACAVLALGLLGSPASLASRTTTAPGKTVLVYFVINDKGVIFQAYRTTQGGGESTDLTFEKYVVRGDFAKFFIVNRGKRQHGFAFMGKKFPDLKPGRKAHFNKALLVRGAFPFHSTTDRGKAFKGIFRVY